MELLLYSSIIYMNSSNIPNEENSIISSQSKLQQNSINIMSLSLHIKRIFVSSSPIEILLKKIIEVFINLIEGIKPGKIPKEQVFNKLLRSKLQKKIINRMLNFLTLFLKSPYPSLYERLLLEKIKQFLFPTNMVNIVEIYENMPNITLSDRQSLFDEEKCGKLERYIAKLEALDELPEVVTFLYEIRVLFISYLFFLAYDEMNRISFDHYSIYSLNIMFVDLNK
jgi:hypothetical protein